METLHDEGDVVQPDVACMIALRRSPFPVDFPQEHTVIALLVCLVNMMLTAWSTLVVNNV